jgi:hypothetical protein
MKEVATARRANDSTMTAGTGPPTLDDITKNEQNATLTILWVGIKK